MYVYIYIFNSPRVFCLQPVANRPDATQAWPKRLSLAVAGYRTWAFIRVPYMNPRVIGQGFFIRFLHYRTYGIWGRPSKSVATRLCAQLWYLDLDAHSDSEPAS